MKPAATWDPVAYAKHGAFVPALGSAVVDLLAAQPGERILDIGCGDGVLTQRLVTTGAVVTGIDADAAMVAAARDRGLDVIVGDGRTLAFDGGFDAVFTNAALHWMGAPERVAAGVFRALRPGGRFVGEFGGFGNLAAVRVAVRAALAARGYRAPDDNYYPTADAFAAVLTGAGFSVARCEILARPTPLTSGIGAWLQTFRGAFVADAGVPADKRAQIFEDVRALLRPVLADDAGNWSADYVRLRFAATKP